MSMEEESISSVYITTSQLGDEHDEDSNSIAGHKSDSEIMPVIAEVASEIHQFTNSNEEEKGVVEFKAEPSGCSEMGGMELDHFATVEEVEMGSMMKTEVVGLEEGEQSQDGEGEIVQDAPQQFIILARTDGGNETVKFPNGMSSKYIRIDGADGQTYVLAVADDVQEMIQEQSKNTQNHQIATNKNLKAGRKRPASSSTPSTTPSASMASRAKSSHNASTDGVNQAWFTTRDDKNALHSEGHKWKQGQWTKEEVDILEANINSYCKEHNIKDPAEVIFEMSKDERKDFYRTIALGIQRPLFSVYRRVTRMYDRKNHRGKYSSAEMKSLRVLRAKHGNDWAAIGAALGRSASSVKDKCRLMKDNCNSGKWYPEEEARLAAAVYDLTGVKPSESITSGLSWASVAEHVGTRSEKQCRTKWLNYLNWKQQGGADWTREDDTLLIEKVSKMDVNNDSEIDWVALSQDWASVRSPQWLRGKWWALKRHIADYNKLSYPALLEQMKQVIYWNLKPKVGTRHPKGDVMAGAGTSSEMLKNCIPVSLTTGVDASGALSLSYCPPDEEGFQAFEVLQQWTPQIIQGPAISEGAQSILNGEGGHIIVQTLAPSIGDSIHLNGQQQVIISTTGVSTEEEGTEGMTIQVTDGLVQNDQDLSVLTSTGNLQDTRIGTTFATGGEEIVTVSSFHGQSETGDQDIMSHDVFETVTSESGGDLVMGVASPHHANSFMNSLKDPILMSSSVVECDKSQSAVLTDVSSELID